MKISYFIIYATIGKICRKCHEYNFDLVLYFGYNLSYPYGKGLSALQPYAGKP